MSPDMVGERIRSSRKERNLSQHDLAVLAHIPQSLLSHIESGVRKGANIRLSAARRIAFALGVSLDALAGMPSDEQRNKE